MYHNSLLTQRLGTVARLAMDMAVLQEDGARTALPDIEDFAGTVQATALEIKPGLYLIETALSECYLGWDEQDCKVVMFYGLASLVATGMPIVWEVAKAQWPGDPSTFSITISLAGDGRLLTPTGTGIRDILHIQAQESEHTEWQAVRVQRDSRLTSRSDIGPLDSF